MYGTLTETEKSIVYWIGKGFKNDEIAKILGLSKATVATYIFHLSKQHGAKNRIDLFNKVKGEVL